MKALIVSYSHIGNNDKLAKQLATELSADHIQLEEIKARTNFTIFLDLVFDRKPKINPLDVDLEKFDSTIFVGPVWFGKIASPFRSYFKTLKNKPANYAFVTICGGVTGTNPKLAGELEKRLGTAPKTVINLLISEILPANPKPTPKKINSYRVSDEEVIKLSKDVLKRLKEGIL